jgi:hypothetical protein
VDVFGIPLPFDAAMAALWDRVFTRGDALAHQRIYEILKPRVNRDSATPPYVAALEEELTRRAEILFAARWQEIPRVVACLRQCDAARPLFWHLLESADPRLHEIGRELLLAEAGAHLSAETATAADVRSWLDRLWPNGDVWEKIQLCQRLQRHGVRTPLLKECLRQLRAERPVACPECGAPVPQGHLEIHLRREHHIYEFRGARMTVEAAVSALLYAVCGGADAAAAWEMLESLAHDEKGNQAESFLATSLTQALNARAKQGPAPNLEPVAEVLAGHGDAAAMAVALAAVPKTMAHHLALALVLRLPSPQAPELAAAVRPLLANRRVPHEVRYAAAGVLLRTTGTSGPAAMRLLRTLVSRSGKVKAVERLRRLNEQIGPAPAIDQMCEKLEQKIRLSCPRCGVQLRRPQMTRHVWTHHGLLLYGRRVREPWQLVEYLIDEYQGHGQRELLDHCRELGQFLDSQNGLTAVYRMLLTKGVKDREAREVLEAQARQEGATLCPHCFVPVLIPDDFEPRPLEESHGRLWGEGYGVGVEEIGLVPHLEAHTPQELLYSGREPGRWLTRKASLLLVAGPLLLLALALAGLQPVREWWPMDWAFRMLLLSLLAALGISLWWRLQPPAVERALNYAWKWLVPRLHRDGWSWVDGAFLADLAVTSRNRGKRWVRKEPLEQAAQTTRKAAVAHAAPLAFLAPLRRLAIEDKAASGADPVPLVVEELRACFEGDLPFAYAGHLLSQWECDWWSEANLIRLRVLLCDLAFEAGLEIRNLFDACREVPPLADVLLSEDVEELARLRLLWSLRPARPWDRWSDPVTVFELASDGQAGRAVLERCPDVLLADRQTPEILLCGSGLVFQDRLFTEPPRLIEVRGRRGFEGVDFELVVGDLRLRYTTDPAPLVHRLERWFRYHFGDFLPRVSAVYGWEAPGPKPPLLLRETIRCPECRRLLVPRSGHVGGSLEAARLKGKS